MKFAVVELKYVRGKTYIVPISWIKKFNPKFKQTESFLCYISSNVSDEPDFNADYYKNEFNGKAGIFKIFVLKVSNSIEGAIVYQREKRLKSLPNKFRESSNTESEILAEQKRKRSSEKKVQKTNKRIAMVKNISYLSDTLFNCPIGEETALAVSCDTNDSTASVAVSKVSIPDQNDTKQTSAVILDVATTSEQCLSKQTGGRNIEIDGDIQRAVESSISYVDAKSKQTIMVTHSKAPSVQDPDNFEPNVSDSDVSVAEEPYIIPKAKMSSNELQKEDQFRSTSDPNVQSCAFTERQKLCNKKQQSAVDRDTYTAIVNEAYERESMHQSSSIVHDAEKENSQFNLCVGQSTVNINAVNESAIQTLGSDYVELMTALDGNMYIIPADDQLSGILNSFENNMENVSITEIVTEAETGRSNNTSQKLFTSGLMPCEGSSLSETWDVAAVLDLKKKNDDILAENASLQQQNSALTNRNAALQDALVSSAKTVPPVGFEAKDGGRLYNGSVFLNETQCAILDKTEDPQKYLNNLALAVFGSRTLKNSSVTGSVSNNFKTPAKPMLDPQLLNLIYSLMASKTNCRCFTRSRINQILNKKIYNLNATGKARNPNKK